MRRFTTGRSPMTAPTAANPMIAFFIAVSSSWSSRCQRLVLVVAGRLISPVHERLAARPVLLYRDCALREAALEDLHGALRGAGVLAGRRRGAAAHPAHHHPHHPA